MSTRTRKEQDRTALPWVRPRRGFAWLPITEQFASLSVVVVLLLALFPLLIEPNRTTRTVRQALRRPPTVAAALTRLERQYMQAWWWHGNDQERAIRGKVLLVSGGIVLLGAVAGRAAQAPLRQPVRTPIRFGTTTTTRTRAALYHEE